jgi:hypothetical protein
MSGYVNMFHVKQYKLDFAYGHTNELRISRKISNPMEYVIIKCYNARKGQRQAHAMRLSCLHE